MSRNIPANVRRELGNGALLGMSPAGDIQERQDETSTVRGPGYLETPQAQKPEDLQDLFTSVDVAFRLLQLRKGRGVCEHEFLRSGVATAVGPRCEYQDFAVSEFPGPLERVRAAQRSHALGELRSVAAARGGRSRRARGWRRRCGKLRSITVVTLQGRAVVGQEVLVHEDAAALHRVSAAPRREQDSLQDRVLLGVLLDGRALEAVDRWYVHSV